MEIVKNEDGTYTMTDSVETKLSEGELDSQITVLNAQIGHLQDEIVRLSAKKTLLENAKV